MRVRYGPGQWWVGLGWLLPLVVALAWVPGACAQLPEDPPLVDPALFDGAGDSTGAPGGPEIVPVGCSTCNSGLLGGLLGPPDPGFTGVSGCGGCGRCVPGRDACCVCDDKKTIVGRFLCGVYDCVCCPDPCYEGKWIPLADAAFYLDAVRPVTMTGLRYDGGRDFIFPDRNEYFWARADGMGKGPKPPAGVLAETKLRYDQFSLVTQGSNGVLGLVVTTPFLSINGQETGHAAGLGDITIATKTLLFDCELLQVSFQMKTYVPSGNFLKGLGTGHVSLEPSVLMGIKLTPTTYFQSQVAEWIPIGGDPSYQGDILHSQFSVNQQLCLLAPRAPLILTTELGTYTFQHGNYTDPVLGSYQRSSGETYVYAGPGLRLFICDRCDFGVAGDFALTEQHFAKEVFTFDFRYRY
jgi:hypothetical protein